MTASLAEQVAALPDERDRLKLLQRIAADVRLSLALLLQSWAFWRRPEQHRPSATDWLVWLIMTGRGWGKTRTGAEWVLDRIEAGTCKVGALAGRTVGDVRATMIYGDSGLVKCAEARGLVADYVAGKRTVFVRRGDEVLAELEVITAVEPDGPRGRSYDTVWADELAAWAPKVGPSGETCWANLMFALRAGRAPRAVVTTTPKNVAVLRELVAREYVTITHGSLYDNRSNLAPEFVDLIVSGYEGTRLAAQEIHGELLLTVEGALWDQDAINLDRWEDEPTAPVLLTVVGVDPATEGGEHGIVVVRAYRVAPDRVDVGVIADFTVRGKPTRVAQRVLQAVREYDADEVVVEKNQGGQWVASVLSAGGIREDRVRVRYLTAKLAKADRARPIAVLSDRHRVHMIGRHTALEGQMTGWDPEDDSADSPDRLDAMVHAVEACRRLVERPRTKRRKPTGRSVAVPSR